MSTVTPVEPTRLEDVPGWFWDQDRHSFEWLLARQERVAQRGDLLELGAYLGRSAIVMGRHLRPGERFTVCDLFDSDAPDEDNTAEMAMSYRRTLTREAFEVNYLAFHEELPEVVQAPTSVLADGRIPAGSCRFVHVDASHLYEHVAGDIQVARAALAPEGVLVLDDYRSEHCPGVGAAIWEAVFHHDLRPVLLTGSKFYGTWGDPTELQEELLATGGGAEGCWLNVDTIGGHRVLRLDGQPARLAAFPLPRNAPDPVAAAAAAAAEAAAAEAEAAAATALRAAQDLAERRARAAAARRPAAVARQVAADLLPPVVASAIRRARRRG